MDERFLQLVKKYRSTFPQKLMEIKTAREENNIPGLHALLHKLTGSSGGYGFMQMSGYCSEAMELTRNNPATLDTETLDLLLSKIYKVLESNSISE